MVKNSDSRQTVLFVLGVILLMVALLPACAPAPYGPYDRYGPPSFEIPAGLRVGLILAGLASLLAGWAIYRFVLAIPGFIIGALMGAALVHNQSELVILLAALFFGIIGAAIALALIDLAIFLTGAFIGGVLTAGLLLAATESEPNWLLVIVGALIGGVLLLALRKFLVIVATALLGSLLIAAGLGWGEPWFVVLLTLIGIAVQYGGQRLYGQEEKPTAPTPTPSPGAAAAPSSPAAAAQAPVVAPPLPPSPPVAEPTARLIFRSGAGTGRTVPMRQSDLTMGRRSDNDVVIADRAVSRRHALIRFARGRYYLQDQDSSHGTFLNGQRIGASVLKDGDRITIGDTDLEFRLD
jgi:hypothetical protein